jgi:hypothetical protein
VGMKLVLALCLRTIHALVQQQGCAVALDIHAWTLYLFTDHFSDARISRMSLSTLMEAISRSSQSISSQPVCVCLRVQKFQGGAQRGIENPQGILPWSAEYTRVYCTGVPQSGEAKFPVTPERG